MNTDTRIAKSKLIERVQARWDFEYRTLGRATQAVCDLWEHALAATTIQAVDQVTRQLESIHR